MTHVTMVHSGREQVYLLVQLALLVTADGRNTVKIKKMISFVREGNRIGFGRVLDPLCEFSETCLQCKADAIDLEEQK
jgi:hypothetical protein